MHARPPSLSDDSAEPKVVTRLVTACVPRILFLWTCCLVPFALASDAGAVSLPDTLVVCPAELQPALAPWLAYRRAQGHVIEIARPGTTSQHLGRQIQLAASKGSLRFVVLIGDAPPPSDEHASRLESFPLPGLRHSLTAVRPITVPVALAPAEVNIHWGSEEEIATDSSYADVDGDGLPDVAIGRLAVDTPEQLRDVVAKILHYERSAGHDLWRRRVNIVAGLGGFGWAADTAMEMVTKTLLNRGVPDGYHTQLTYANWQSPYCPAPTQFRDCLIEQFNAGCLFWVYLGHGNRTLLDDVYVPGGAFPILTKPDVRRLEPRMGNPIALLIACYSGAYDSEEDCLAETMLASPAGPVAVIAGSRVTLPYGNAVFCSEIMRECFTHRRATLGEVLLYAKRSCFAEDADDPYRGNLGLLASLLSPAPINLAAERREHTLLYNLLGDPLLRISYGDQVQLDAPPSAAPGTTLMVQGISPMAGECTLELTGQRGHLTFSPPQREHYTDSPDSAAEYNDTYHRANNRHYASITIPVPEGPFTAELPIPHSARGKCVVRAFVTAPQLHALGATTVSIRSE